jgi:uncharacterized phage infection (PIP) family protein YhgE
VAQDQKIEFLFAAQVSGQEQLVKLTQSVDALRKEMDALKAVNGPLAAGMGAVEGAARKSGKGLDEAAKAIRNTRQGTQQLGMQFNDLATSISTGASPVQAFNQQIGQIGFAMSMMGGKLGALGSFLAGPWSILVIGAAMVLGPLIEGLLDTGAAAEEAKKKADNLSKAESAFRDSTLKLMESRLALQGPIEKNVEGYRKLYVASLNAANADLQSARAAVTAAQQRIRAAEIEATTIAKLKSGSREGKTGIAKSGLAGVIGSAVGFGLDLFGYGKGGQAAREEKMVADTAANIAEAGVNAAQKILNDFEKDAARGFKKPLTEAQQRSAARRAAAEAKRIAKEAEAERQKELKSIESFMDKIGKVGMKEIPAYQREIATLEKEFMELSKVGQAATIAPFKAAVESIEMSAYSDALAENAKDAEKMIADIVKDTPEIKMSVEMEAIISRADDMRTSFESVGQSVSDAFKGMLTGATSFKDGMRSIIGSVIDELWKLFVVQQIVGFITGTVAPALGIKLPKRALGGSVDSNKPYMVGERGPELFVPGGNGTIIPNNNMRGGNGGGSSFNISVDARGSNDPAAVRAQVMQGILETAPAIIAAAESRTISNLRRPRLGGAMQ